MTRRRTAVAVAATGMLGSQAGHLIAFQLRFGAAAQHVQTSGSHAYFPLLAKASLGIAGLALLTGLFVIGLARVLTARSRARAGSRASVVGLLAVLFTFQLTCFAGQEVSEALITGSRVDSATALLLWGTLGQLPVAAVGAVALAWLLSRFESAVDDIRAALARGPVPIPIPVAIPTWTSPTGALLLAHIAGGSLVKRGPPSSSRISFI